MYLVIPQIAFHVQKRIKETRICATITVSGLMEVQTMLHVVKKGTDDDSKSVCQSNAANKCTSTYNSDKMKWWTWCPAANNKDKCGET